MNSQTDPKKLHDERERWKFEVRQAMIEYGSAVKACDPAAILASSTKACDLIDEIVNRLDKAERFKVALYEWIDKTEWVQETCEGRDLGMHRADVMRRRLDEAQAEIERLRAVAREASDAATIHQAEVLRLRAELQREHEDHRQAVEDAVELLRQRERLWAALHGLVALEDLKERIDRFDSDTTHRAKWLQMRDDYLVRKPIAWAAARAAIDAVKEK